MFPNPGHDIARISRNRRTSASRTAVLNMGQSPRIYSGVFARPKKKKEENGVEGRGHEYHHGSSNNGKSVEGEEVAGNAIQATTTMKGMEKNVDIIVEKNKGRSIYIAKRRAKHRARKKMNKAAQKTSTSNNDDRSIDGTAEQKCTKKTRGLCNDGLPHIPDRSPRECLPSQEEMLSLLLKSLPLVPSSLEEQGFEEAFRQAMDVGCRPHDDVRLCRTPLSYITSALNSVGNLCCEVSQLSSLSEMFEENSVKLGISKESLREVYLMDVFLNRSPSPPTCAPVTGKSIHVDPDIVALMKCLNPGECDDSFDYLFRTCLAFIPNAGIFYCARDRLHPDVGANKSLISLPMSWLRLQRHHHLDGTPFYTFGKDSYVKRLFYDDRKLISVWRIGFKGLQHDERRLIYRAEQCQDSNGPKLPPDVFSGEDAGAWPQEELAVVYNQKLASANSAREGGRHYALGCHHFKLPTTCWVLDPMIDPIIDVMIDVEPTGNCKNMQTVLQVRHTLNLGLTQGSIGEFACQKVYGWLQTITACNMAIHQAVSVSSARNGTGDVGAANACPRHKGAEQEPQHHPVRHQ